MTANDIIQAAIVAAILIAAIIWIIRKIRKKSKCNSCDENSCAACPLADKHRCCK